MLSVAASVRHYRLAALYCRCHVVQMLTCPSCRRPLPRCSLCLLNMGCINPYLQLQYEMQHRHGKAGAAAVDDADSELASDRNAMPFADWWTWCQSCRHGGHATHLAEVRGGDVLACCAVGCGVV